MVSSPSLLLSSVCKVTSTIGYYGIFHVAEYSLLLRAKLKDVPPGIGTLLEVLAKYGLTTHG
jgi:hypothetical protein